MPVKAEAEDILKKTRFVSYLQHYNSSRIYRLWAKTKQQTITKSYSKQRGQLKNGSWHFPVSK